MSRPVPLPATLRSRLDALAARTRLLRALRGAGLLVLFLCAGAGLEMVADYFFDLPQFVRQAALLTWGVLGLAFFCDRLLLPVCRRVPRTDLAAAVETAYPSLAERLTSSVELAGKEDLGHGSPQFVSLLVDATEKATRKLDFRVALPGRHAARALTVASLAVALLLMPAAVRPGEYGDLVHRFLRPWTELPAYVITVSPGDIAAARGASVPVEVTVRPRNSRILPAVSACLVLTDAENGETSLRMRPDRSDAFSVPLTVSGSGTYRVEARSPRGSAGVSATYQVSAVTPVELAPDSPKVTVTPPAYARATRDEDSRSGLVDLAALQGSLVRFELRFTRPAVAARLEWTAAEVKPANSRADQVAKRTSYAFALKDEGRAAELTLPATASGSYRLILEAEHEVVTELDGGALTVSPDQPPSVVRFAGREELKAVTPYDSLPLECELADDVGVAKAELQYRVNDGPVAREPVPLTGAGRLAASGQLPFALEGKVKDGDTFLYRLRVEDNLPPELRGPHVVYAPADRWLSLKVANQTGPARAREIAERRDALARRVDEIRQALQRELRGLYKLKLESRVEPALTADQRDALHGLEAQNGEVDKMLRDLGKEAEATPALQPLTEAARAIADQEMQQSATALRQAGTARTPPGERDDHFKEADGRLSDALNKLDDLKSRNEQLAKDQADQLRVEALAEKQQKLAEQAEALAKKDPTKDEAAKEEAQRLRREQADVAEELRRLTEESPTLQKALEEARAAQSKAAADRARQLAEAQRALAEAQAQADKDARAERFGPLANEQRALADKAARLADETRQAARAARAQPLRPDEARQAADALASGDPNAAQRAQERSARELERLADALDRALDAARDPRGAARQLARVQDELRQRVQSEVYRKDAPRPLPDRLKDLAREEEAIRKAATQLSLPPGDAGLADTRSAAAERASRAADLLQGGEARTALGQMEQARRALEELAAKLPALRDRQDDARRAVAGLREEQEEIRRQVEQAGREAAEGGAQSGREASQKLGEAAKRQEKLAEAVGKVDAAGEESRRERAREAVKQASTDLQAGKKSEDAAASLEKARRQLERLEQALAGEKPGDEQAKEFAKKQQSLADEAAAADRLTPEQQETIRREQRNLARDVALLEAPDAPGQKSEAAEAARRAAQAANDAPGSPETRKQMQDAARKLEALAKEISGGGDAAEAGHPPDGKGRDKAGGGSAQSAARLAKEQRALAEETRNARLGEPDKDGAGKKAEMEAAGRLAGKQDELSRRAAELGSTGADPRVDEARAAMKRAGEALAKQDGQAAARAQSEAADALERLEPRAAHDAPGGDAGAASAAPPGAPSKEQIEDARQLARKQRALRDAVNQAERQGNQTQRAADDQPRQDPVGELAKRQAEVARRAADLAGDINRNRGDQSALSREGDEAARAARDAARQMQVGSLPAAVKSGKSAADTLRKLSEGLAGAARPEREDPNKDQPGQAADLSRRQEAINRDAEQIAQDADAARTRRQARQEELQRQAGDLEQSLKDIASRKQDGPPDGGRGAQEAAKAAREAQAQMARAGALQRQGNARGARSAQEGAAQSLEQAAKQAAGRSSDQPGDRPNAAQPGQGSQQAGQSVREAKGQMQQAQDQLQGGKPAGAQQAMDAAAKALRQAAGELARSGQGEQSAQPSQPGSPSSAGASPGGRPDPSVFGPGIPKYAGKSWGELPGELRTKIVQDMRAKYGEDYARMIKLYFEQLADTNRPAK